MVPSRLTFSLGSACRGTGGADRLGERSSVLSLSGTMVNVLESSLGGEIMGRAVEPGLGGGKAGAGLTQVASGFGDGG